MREEFFREWLQGQADHKVAKHQRNAERKVTSVGESEVRSEFGQNLVRAIDVLTFDKPAIGSLVTLLKDALSGNTPGQRISQAAFTGDHDRKHALVFITETIHLAHRR